MASSSAAGEPVSWKVFVTEVSPWSSGRGSDHVLYVSGGRGQYAGPVRWVEPETSSNPPPCTGRPSLSLPHTTLTHLSPMEVCDLVGLQRLWVSHHLLTSLPPSLPHLTYLCELFLHQNKFTEFPSVICRLPQLRMLWLSYNQIPRIPEEISILTLLRRLHLDHNAITELPDALCTLSQLQVLYLSHNLVEHISENIASLVSIKHLLLDHNQLSELPLGIVDLQDIQRLDLGHNQLKNLPNEFRAFQTEKNGAGRRVSTTNNPLEKTLTRMRSVDHTSPVLRPRTMSFPLSAGYRRKSDSLSSPSPSPSLPYPRRHAFVHSHSEEQS